MPAELAEQVTSGQTLNSSMGTPASCQSARPRRKGLLTFFWPTNFAMVREHCSNMMCRKLGRKYPHPDPRMQLVFRTVNQDLRRQNANEDFIARQFRDKLMPIRAVTTKVLPKSVQRFQRFVEHPTRGTPGVCNFVDARTTWFDSGVRQAIDDGIKQVVIIAAGFDTRSYRLHSQGVKFFEIDLPEASLKKQKLVHQVLPDSKKYPRPEFLAADLSRTSLMDVLERSSFDAAQPALLLCEGLLYYLDKAASLRLLKDANAIAARGSHIMFDFLHQSALDGSEKPAGYKQTAKAVANKGEPFLSAMDPSIDRLREALATTGWDLSILLSPRDMLSACLPHLSWREDVPPILSFYSFAIASKPLKD